MILWDDICTTTPGDLPAVDAKKLLAIVEEWKAARPKTEFDCLVCTPDQLRYVVKAIPPYDEFGLNDRNLPTNVSVYRFYGFPVFVAMDESALKAMIVELNLRGKRPAVFPSTPATDEPVVRKVEDPRPNAQPRSRPASGW